MRTAPAWLMFAAAGILLAVAAAQMTQRSGKDPATIAARQQQTIQSDIAAKKAELERDRTTIVTHVRELQSAGDHAGAMELASRYQVVQDPELYALYRESASAESARQIVAETRRLIALQCTEARALHEAQDALMALGVPANASHTEHLQLARLGAAQAAALILAQLRGDAASFPIRQQDANAPVHDHRAHVRSDYVKALESGTPDDSLACAWRVTARPGATALKGLELVFWLAPEPSGKDVRAQALRYSSPQRWPRAAPSAHTH